MAYSWFGFSNLFTTAVVIGLFQSTLAFPSAISKRQVSGYTSQGCYSDSTTARALKGKHTSSGTMTLESCASYCAGYVYFGTEYASECYCGDVLSSTSVLKPSTDCSSACSGSSSEICGAASRISLYQDLSRSPATSKASAGNFNYLNCQSDSTSSRSLTGAKTTSSSMTLEVCASYCAVYQYFGTEVGTECYCGNTLGGSAVAETTCQYICGGDATELCGASSTLSVYQIGTVVNQVSDGGFELSDGGISPYSQSSGTLALGYGWGFDGTPAQSGDYYGRLTFGGINGPNSVQLTRQLTLDPAKHYKLSFWAIKIETASCTVSATWNGVTVVSSQALPTSWTFFASPSSFVGASLAANLVFTASCPSATDTISVGYDTIQIIQV